MTAQLDELGIEMTLTFCSVSLGFFRGISCDEEQPTLIEPKINSVTPAVISPSVEAFPLEITEQIKR